MPRAHRAHKLFPLALSPSQASDALGVRPEEVRDLISRSGTPVFQIKNRRRVLVADLVKAVRKFWPRVERTKP
jgi:hypothetical protein